MSSCLSKWLEEYSREAAVTVTAVVTQGGLCKIVSEPWSYSVAALVIFHHSIAPRASCQPCGTGVVAEVANTDYSLLKMRREKEQEGG